MTSTTTTTKTQSFSGAADFSRILAAFAWAVLLSMVAYFVLRKLPRYFVWSEASYGAYYWPRKTVVFPHILMAISALVIGPFQFSPNSKRLSKGTPHFGAHICRQCVVRFCVWNGNGCNLFERFGQ